MTPTLARLAAAGALPFAQNLCARYGVPLDEVLGTRRHKSLVRVRHELRAVVHDTLGLSTTETAHLFGCDHTTVMHSLEERQRRTRELFDLPAPVARVVAWRGRRR